MSADITKLLNELREINETFEDDTHANDAIVDDMEDTGIDNEPVLDPEENRDEILADIIERLVDMSGTELQTVLDNIDEVNDESEPEGIESDETEIEPTPSDETVMSESNVDIEENFEAIDVDEDDEFEVHGYYTLGNSGGYEIMLNPSGDEAKVRDAYGSDNPETSDWLEIEYIPNEDSETLEMMAVIDPNGYNIPLNQVMRANQSIHENKIKLSELSTEFKRGVLEKVLTNNEQKESLYETLMLAELLFLNESYGTLDDQLKTITEDDSMIDEIFDIIFEGEDPCWDNHAQVGAKKKDAKEVPNHVPEDEVNEDSWMKTRAGAEGKVFESKEINEENNIGEYTAKKGVNVDNENGGNADDYVDQAMEKVDKSQETEQEKVEDFIEKKYEKPEEAVGETDVHRGKSPADVDFDIEPSDEYKKRTELEMTTGDSRERNEEEVGEKANIGGQKGDPYTVGMDGSEKEETTTKVGELEVEKKNKRKEHRDNETLYAKDPQPVNEDLTKMKHLLNYKFNDGKVKKGINESFIKQLKDLKNQ